MKIIRCFILIFGLVIFCSLQLFAQHETDNWYFGTNAGISFVSGSPVALTGGMTNTVEGTASISDADSNLLFYTDGVTVWNKNHDIMTNGTDLHGGGSSTQSALIIPLPDSDSLYYIFTVGELGSNYGLQYSIADMSLQSGDGEVTDKNIAVQPSMSEKLTAALHQNGTDYWIIIHGIGNNDYYSYLFSSTGLNTTPVISSVGTIQNAEIGYMKVSHNGKKIACAVHQDYFFELCDFDNSTGDVSNAIFLNPEPTSLGPYGLEFSPNDSLLYGSAYNAPCVVMQWDISLGTASEINNSRVAVGISGASFIGELQLASDGKIYLARYNEYYLGVINDPDVYGMGCNFVDLGFSVSPNFCSEGLPNIVPSFVGNVVSPPLSQFGASDTTLCEKFCISYFDSSLNNPVSWLWTFEGGSPETSTDQNPANICYDDPGVYDVTLITTNANGIADTVTLADYITVYQNPFAPVITQDGNVLTSSFGTTYQWYLNADIIPGATDQSYTITESGLYTVHISNESGCSSESSFQAYVVGITEADDDFILNIFSNPSAEEIIISGSLIGSDEIKIQLINSIGQEVLQTTRTISSHFHEGIEVKNFASGIYFVKVTSGSLHENRKIFVSR